jgi:hypothetical protein
VFVRHIGRVLEGQPGVIIQNMEGAGGFVGAKYVGEIAPRDGTLAGYFTATAFLAALEPERFKVDFKSYEFIGIQAGTSINFVRTDVPPGMKHQPIFSRPKAWWSAAWRRTRPRAFVCGLASTFSACLKIHPRLSLRRCCQARARARRDQCLWGVTAELFLHHRPRTGESRHGDPALHGFQLDGENFFIPESAKSSPSRRSTNSTKS